MAVEGNSTSIYLGEPYDMNCFADGAPFPKVEWLKVSSQYRLFNIYHQLNLFIECLYLYRRVLFFLLL